MNSQHTSEVLNQGWMTLAMDGGLKRLLLISQRLAYPVLGVAILLGLWWLGGYIIATNPSTSSFAGFGPGPAFIQLWDIIRSGDLWGIVHPSLYRIGMGLLWAICIGVPMGISIGMFRVVQSISHIPFQFLRMISPLAWMPIAVLAFASWDSAIVFLIMVAAVWPIMFSTAHGVRRIDPLWFTVGKNLGAGGVQMLARIILPAIAQDVFAGIRLAVGVAWIVLVPAEYLGVTSGLGYAINDARDTLSYDTLTAIVLVIGVIGYILDSICVWLIKRFSWRVES